MALESELNAINQFSGNWRSCITGKGKFMDLVQDAEKTKKPSLTGRGGGGASGRPLAFCPSAPVQIPGHTFRVRLSLSSCLALGFFK